MPTAYKMLLLIVITITYCSHNFLGHSMMSNERLLLDVPSLVRKLDLRNIFLIEKEK